MRTGLQGSPAHVKHRTFRETDQLDRAGDRVVVECDFGVVTRQVQLFDGLGVPPLHGGLGDVLGQIDQHRTRSPRRSQVERRRHDPGNLVGRLNQEVVLGDAHRDAGDVALLKRVRTDRRGRYLTRDHNEGRGVHVRVADGSDDVGGAGPTGDHRDTGTPGCERVSFGHVASTLLVTNEDVTNRRVDNRVVDGQDRPPGQAEDRVDPLVLQALDECLRSSELHNAPFVIR